jgi:RTX toxin RtxA
MFLIAVLLSQCEGEGKRMTQNGHKPLRARSRAISRLFNEMAIGGEAERVDGYDPREEQRKRREAGDTGPDSFSGSRIETLVITTETAVLRGYVYRPESPGEQDRGVIFFSGSGGSNPSMAGTAAAAYNRMGVPVFGVDYRGFGGSNNIPPLPPLTGSTITEASMYEDGHRIYRYVRDVAGIKPSGIILHGFSLGGAVAARVAADIAREAPGGRENRLGGLVLHSSIRTMTRAAAATLPLPEPLALVLGWLGGRLAGGSYNTALYLEELAKYDPDIAIHFRGGSAEMGDDLSLENTGLDRVRAFRNATVWSGGEGHQSPEPGSKQGANMSEGLEDLERMIR